MLESLLSFLLGWTTAGQCSARLSSIQLPTIANIFSAKDSDTAGVPITHIFTASENELVLRIETGELVRVNLLDNLYQIHTHKKFGWQMNM